MVETSVIEDAIRNRKVLRLRYRDDSTERIIEPIEMGTMQGKGGKTIEVVRVWQRSGPSRSLASNASPKDRYSGVPGYRMMALERIESAVDTGERFSTNRTVLRQKRPRLAPMKGRPDKDMLKQTAVIPIVDNTQLSFIIDGFIQHILVSGKLHGIAKKRAEKLSYQKIMAMMAKSKIDVSSVRKQTDKVDVLRRVIGRILFGSIRAMKEQEWYMRMSPKYIIQKFNDDSRK